LWERIRWKDTADISSLPQVRLHISYDFDNFDRDDYWKNPKPSAEADAPVLIKNVICFFDKWQKTKNKKTSHIPEGIRDILYAQRGIIFVTRDE